jgi:hypothetical protein
MNTGMWITFLPSSGRADLTAGWRGAMTPPCALRRGRLMTHLNTYRND